MSFLADSFPNDYKSEFAERSLEIGTVIRLHFTDTTPPKIKYLIIIGVSGDSVALGIVLINTEINPNRFPSDELRKLHIALTPDERNLVEHDCYIDCSQIFDKKADVIRKQIEAQPESVRGKLKDSELRIVQNTITRARTISLRDKIKFGYA